MNWLITGGCGFLGTRLIYQLLKSGDHQIRVVDNLAVGARKDLASVCDYTELSDSIRSTGSPEYEKGRVQLVIGDVLDEQLALVVSKDADVIVHFAANTGVAPSVENPRMDCVTNVLGTFNYLEAARECNVRRFVFASSGAPVGETDPPIHEELAAHPVSPYGASKLAGEGYCSAFYRTYGVDTISLRFGNVYGPGSTHKSSVVAKFIQSAMLNQKLEVYGDGNQTRDFIYIDDLIRAVQSAAMVDGIGGEVFQIATSSETTINELLDLMLPLLEKAGVSIPKVDNLAPRLGDVMRNYSDTTKSLKRLGWEAETSLENGLIKTIDWYVNHGTVDN